MQLFFHANVFVRPEHTIAGAPIKLRGVQVAPLQTTDGQPLTFDAYFPVSFDEALATLLTIPRLDAEPDGFFVLAGGWGASHWRVSGHLFDFAGRLHRVELHGDCPAETFDALVACFGGPAAPMVFELVQEGVALEEGAFRAWAAHSSPRNA